MPKEFAFTATQQMEISLLSSIRKDEVVRLFSTILLFSSIRNSSMFFCFIQFTYVIFQVRINYIHFSLVAQIVALPSYHPNKSPIPPSLVPMRKKASQVLRVTQPTAKSTLDPNSLQDLFGRWIMLWACTMYCLIWKTSRIGKIATSAKLMT